MSRLMSRHSPFHVPVHAPNHSPSCPVSCPFVSHLMPSISKLIPLHAPSNCPLFLLHVPAFPSMSKYCRRRVACENTKQEATVITSPSFTCRVVTSRRDPAASSMAKLLSRSCFAMSSPTKPARLWGSGHGSKPARQADAAESPWMSAKHTACARATV